MLPAEYGIDPTRIGGLLGLTKMGEIKVSLAEEAARVPGAIVPPCAPTVSVTTPPIAPAAAPSTPVPTTPAPSAKSDVPAGGAGQKSDVTKVSLQPGESKEVKLTMREGARAKFSWSTDKGVVSFDLHSDHPTDGYHGYGKGSGVAADAGELVAAFDGRHGWYWRNRTDDVVTITLKTEGEYSEIKELK